MKLVVQRVFHRSLAGSAACVVLRQRRMEAQHKLRAQLRRAQNLHRLVVQGLPTKAMVVIGTWMTCSLKSCDML